MSEELKPCPFCGGEPYTLDTREGWHIECSNDDCVCQPSLYTFYHRFEDAVEKWNTRHIPKDYVIVRKIDGSDFVLGEPDCDPIYQWPGGVKGHKRDCGCILCSPMITC